MDQPQLLPTPKTSDPCSELMMKAEKELSAFAAAVTELFGPEQAGQSIEDWMEELESSNWSPDLTPDWRSVTIAAASRLATRLRTRIDSPANLLIGASVFNHRLNNFGFNASTTGD